MVCLSSSTFQIQNGVTLLSYQTNEIRDFKMVMIGSRAQYGSVQLCLLNTYPDSIHHKKRYDHVK
jgi:hypothetical protein